MKSLFAKIMLAQVMTVVLALLVVVFITRASLDRGFIDFLERQESEVLGQLAPVLGELYTARGGWDFLRNQPHNWRRILRQTRPVHPAAVGPPADFPHPGPGFRGSGGPAADPNAGDEPLHWLRSFDRLRLRQRLFLLDERRELLAGPAVEETGRMPLQAVIADGSTVGWVGFLPVREGLPPEARRFLRGQLRVLALSLLVALLLAAGLGYALARHLSRPVRRLDETVRDLSHGQYQRRAAVSARDEIGRLGDNVNRLAETLDRHRTARQRWMADIAHELRTPVAILKGEIEALADGLRPPDTATFSSLSEEIDQLSVLVDDLQSLALADAGALNLQQRQVDVAELLRQACEAFRDRLAGRGIALEAELPDSLHLHVDPQRLRQLVNNLLENGVRYVEEGGRLRVTLRRGSGGAEVAVEDSGPGVGPELLDRLFERFYRVEAGRSRAGGGSGLGLAICRSIAEAHGGRLWADRSSLGGLAVRLVLPDGVDER